MHEEYSVTFGKGKSLSCLLSKPAKNARNTGVILAHGAGGDSTSGNLPLIAEALVDAGYVCIRFTCKPTRLSYRVKACQAVLEDAAAQADLQAVNAWVFAGHSMEALRDTPLVDLACPVLFVRGTKDNMCQEPIFSDMLEQMSSAQVQVHAVEGGNHSLSVPGGKEKVQEALQAALAAMSDFLNDLEADGQAEQPQPSGAPHAGDKRRAATVKGESAKQGAESSGVTKGGKRKRS